jgi:hypothetical protein
VSDSVKGHWPTADEVASVDDIDPLPGLGRDELVATIRGLEALLVEGELRYVRASDVEPHCPADLDHRQVGRSLAHLADHDAGDLEERYAIPVRVEVDVSRRSRHRGETWCWEVVRHG